jgi:hypothetical protein
VEKIAKKPRFSAIIGMKRRKKREIELLKYPQRLERADVARISVE